MVNSKQSHSRSFRASKQEHFYRTVSPTPAYFRRLTSRALDLYSVEFEKTGSYAVLAKLFLGVCVISAHSMLLAFKLCYRAVSDAREYGMINHVTQRADNTRDASLVSPCPDIINNDVEAFA